MEEENLIALLKETLKFYGDIGNYKNLSVERDNGHMARFALDQVKKIEDVMNKLEVAFDELENRVTEKTPDEIQKELNNFLNGR